MFILTLTYQQHHILSLLIITLSPSASKIQYTYSHSIAQITDN